MTLAGQIGKTRLSSGIQWPVREEKAKKSSPVDRVAKEVDAAGKSAASDSTESREVSVKARGFGILGELGEEKSPIARERIHR